MAGQFIYVFVFCFCFYLLIRGLPFRSSPWIGIPLLAIALFLLYNGRSSSLTTTLIRYLRFVLLYAAWSAIFLRIHLRYAVYLAVAYQIFMGIWISCTQVLFFCMGISDPRLLTICTGILRILSILLIRRYCLKVSPERNPSLHEMAISLFPAAACFVANLVLFDGLSNSSMQMTYQALLPVLVVFFGISAMLVLINSEYYFEVSRYKSESEKAHLQLEAQYQLLLQEQENSRHLHALHHDMRGHLQTIQAMAGSENVQEYIRQIENSIHALEPAFFTGSPTLDALLTRKKVECDQQHIDLECYIHLSHADYIPMMELCSLFFNCIDNAIEAIVSDNPSERFIHLTGGEINEKMVIRIENPYAHTLKPAGTLFVSTKPDQTHHGFGLANVREIVARHKGTLTIQTDDGKFIVTWCIPHP